MDAKTLDRLPSFFRDFVFQTLDGDQIKIRTSLNEDGSFLFHASDLCRLLELGNPTNAIDYHLDDDEAYKVEVGNVYPEWFVTKSGLYGLMLGSNKPQAKAFKRWLRKEVLVKLEAEGIYIAANATQQSIDAAIAQHEALKEYTVKLENNIDGWFNKSYDQQKKIKLLEASLPTKNNIATMFYRVLWEKHEIPCSYTNLFKCLEKFLHQFDLVMYKGYTPKADQMKLLEGTGVKSLSERFYPNSYELDDVVPALVKLMDVFSSNSTEQNFKDWWLSHS